MKEERPFEAVQVIQVLISSMSNSTHEASARYTNYYYYLRWVVGVLNSALEHLSGHNERRNATNIDMQLGGRVRETWNDTLPLRVWTLLVTNAGESRDEPTIESSRIAMSSAWLKCFRT